jgi:HEAT repeat protein
VWIKDLRVTRRAWGREAGEALAESVVEERLRLELAASGLFEMEPAPAVGAKRARLIVIYGADVAAMPKNERAVHVMVSLTLRWMGLTDEAGLLSNVLSETPVARKDRARTGEIATAQVSRTLSDAVADFVLKEKIRRLDPAAFEAALDSPDPELRALAFRVIGERKLRHLLPKLLTYLSSPDARVRDGAIGALVALGDPRAVKPLTELSKFRDLPTMVRVIDAVSAIGGEEARSYLELVASGHEVPEMREVAAKALEHLLEREGARR